MLWANEIGTLLALLSKHVFRFSICRRSFSSALADRFSLTQKRTLQMAYLQITLQIAAENRAAAAEIYSKYKGPFLDGVQGAKSKELLIRDEDVQVLHGFDTAANAKAYLETPLFNDDVVTGLKPLLAADPEVRVYDVA
ncbi:hypothetical protein MIC97_24725 [Aquamicrobium sp. NLF2-7]|uniref:hypothetical protein n=1 Tax=Aquamicrobium sp. NLF2-7 TaxID=2918753 RepID=UPI001EFB5DFB|nr:hypothetical protein [Aquamicrobium sp. NLF2-7]MCG8274685.1 hypothetical protein [Aquamicrobium sp. NLF2-7]